MRQTDRQTDRQRQRDRDRERCKFIIIYQHVFKLRTDRGKFVQSIKEK